ncbi:MULTISPECIES: hypothetical protein [Halobacterium]|uniref:DUF7260 family protein n=1 Tax=Halobacterium TaxID=2239 RepID=UPI00073E976D|nr:MULTISPECIES: hypothetical protein [Halobacterium]MCG1003212.1 hypothetical protein [Halobacterium noricense]
MLGETHLRDARERARSERSAVQEKLAAYDQFISRVRELSPETDPAGQRARALSAGGAQSSGPATGTNTGCAGVRSAFRDTVRPYSVDDLNGDESLLETIRSELSDTIAVALAPATETGLTNSLQDAVVAASRSRRVEARAMETAVDREVEQLETATATVESILEWLVSADETPLTELGFDELQARHATLDAHREDCGQLLADRQAFLDRSTNHAARAGMTHRTLTSYLYHDLPVDYPVLSTGVRVETLCADSQRTIRSHLTRRV